jgi:hypothetical protein
MTESLQEWLAANQISYHEIDNEVFEIEGFGKLFINDLTEVESIFRKDNNGETIFNIMSTKTELIEQEVFYTCFQFGDNWYYFDMRGEFRLNILKYIGKRLPTIHSTGFVNLGIHTPFELLNGSFQISDWIRKAKYLGQNAIGICDKNTMAGTLVLQKECQKEGLGFVIGYTLDMQYKEDIVPIKVYCQTNEGLSNLLRIQKEINVDSENKTLSFSNLQRYCKGNVIVLGTLAVYWMFDNIELVKALNKVSKVYYQVDLTEFKADRFDKAYLEALKFFYDKETFVPPVLICDNYYLDKDDAKNKIILNKISDGAAHMQSDEQYFKDLDEHYKVIDQLFSDEWDKWKIFTEMCNNTIKIAEGAKAAYETTRNFMPQYDMTPEEREKYGDRHNMFNQIIEEGFKKLVPKGKEEEYRKRVEYEKYVIESTDNIDYFLVQYDTVNWANEQGIMTGISRGSGGGCLLLYLMGITKLDPLKYNLIFERFLLPDRSGLYEANTTVIQGKIESKEYVEISMNGKTYSFDRDAKFLVKRGDEEIEVYADELMTNDDIIFDNRDLIWTINEL